MEIKDLYVDGLNRVIRKDYERLPGLKSSYISLLLSNISFQITFWFRVTQYLGLKGLICKPLYYLSLLIFRHYKFKYGVSIPSNTCIDEGLTIHHYSCIILTPMAKIGKNFTIYQGVTIGRVHEGKRAGVPIIGDNVTCFAGSKVIGNVKIGNNVLIGANAVVTHDIPDNAVVAGVPARIIRFQDVK